MKRNLQLLSLSLLLLVGLSTCGLLFAPLHPRDNPLDPKSAIAAPATFNAVASSDASIILRVMLDLGEEDSDRFPAGFRIVRNNERTPMDISDGTKIWDEPIDPSAGNQFVFEDVNEPEDDPDGLISGDNIYFYAIWAYDDRQRTFVGPSYDDAVTTMMPLIFLYPNPENDGYVYATGGTPSNSNFDLTTLSIKNDPVPKDYSYGLVLFDIPETMRGDYAVSALLRIEHMTSPSYTGPSTDIYVERVVEDWKPGDPVADLYYAASSSSFVTTGGSVSAPLSNGETPATIFTFDIRELVNDWLSFEPNFGIRISCGETGSNFVSFSTWEGTWVPEIEIWFYPDDPEDLP